MNIFLAGLLQVSTYGSGTSVDICNCSSEDTEFEASRWSMLAKLQEHLSQIRYNMIGHTKKNQTEKWISALMGDTAVKYEKLSSVDVLMGGGVRRHKKPSGKIAITLPWTWTDPLPSPHGLTLLLLPHICDHLNPLPKMLLSNNSGPLSLMWLA